MLTLIIRAQGEGLSGDHTHGKLLWGKMTQSAPPALSLKKGIDMVLWIAVILVLEKIEEMSDIFLL